MQELEAADIATLYTFCQELAKSAGAIILQGSKAILGQKGQQDHGVNEKKNAVDLVTEWDVRVEEFVKKEIKENYPDFAFIGEESYSAGDQNPITDSPTFCVDPIDGTTNFVHGFPYACISIGVIYRRSPIIGVIYNPFLDQLYHGLKGQGSYLVSPLHPNPLRLPLSNPAPLRSLSEAQIAVEWGSDRSKQVIEAKTRSFARLVGDGSSKGSVEGGKMVHSLRSLGSAALNFAHVASGGLDIYWEIGCWPWDVCAGIVIAQEAGGLVGGASDTALTGTVDENILTGRKYIVIRDIADAQEESGLDAQKRLIREFYETVEEWAAN
ncbi:Myo-inositol-1(or 4)-monophosphatase [Ceratobasidium theobromae]|uniref:Inositol-1-monophosphatase n=1 Tax=Ceratobasidium theobromae TaxID=1582974 RepID=A0A5N5QS13_9AGAM|nr:Myo-inositol-1(or 4)-monophosphatase [Ceratobasidium theobromae]